MTFDCDMIPGCDECGNDDGPHRYDGRDLCLDCLEMLYPDKAGTDVLAIEGKVDPVLLPRDPRTFT